jgi:hypothetical protein
VIFLLSAAFYTSCRETKTKTIVKEVSLETKETTEESKGILERAATELGKEIENRQ